MKLIRRLLLTLSAASLVACGTKPTSSVDSSSNIDTSIIGSTESSSTGESSSSTTPVASNWTKEASDLMVSKLGEEIPYIKLGADYTCSVEKEGGTEYVYIFSSDAGDVSSTYIKLLDFAGYDYLTTDESAGYPRYVYGKTLGKDRLVIQFDYYPGSGVHEKGFEIFAWIEEYVNPKIDYELITDWPADLKSGFIEKFGEVIPLAPLSSGITFEWVEDDKNYIIKDAIGKEEAFDRYFDLLDKEPEWVLSRVYASRGWAVFEKPCDNIEYGNLHLNFIYTKGEGFKVDVWMTIDVPPAPLTEWSESDKALFRELFVDDKLIPLPPVTVNYTISKVETDENIYDGFFIAVTDNSAPADFMDQFKEILEAAGYVENTYYYERFGYYVYDKQSPIQEAFNIEIVFMVVNGTAEIHFGKSEILGGIGFVDDFPIAQLKNFLLNNECRYTAIPQFEPDHTGQYLYGVLEQEFYIGIYNDTGKDMAADYAKALENAGWTIDDSHVGENDWGYFARKKGVDFYFRFWSDDIEFAVFIYPNSYDCME